MTKAFAEIYTVSSYFLGMNIHPIFVHFPIALLTFYALLEILQFRLLTSKHWYHPAKLFLLYAGTLAAIPTLITGKIAENIVGGSPLIRMHSIFGLSTLVIFAFLSACYLIEWRALGSYPAEWNLALHRAFSWATMAPWSVLLALLGLGAIIITGALGGAIVYGPDFEPFMSFIYHLFF